MADTTTPAIDTTPAADSESLQPYLDRIYAMDPITDVPGPVKFPSDLRMSPPTIDALPHDHQRELRMKLDSMHPDDRQTQEPKLVIAAMREIVRKQRALTGVGEDALPYHREEASVAGDVLAINREIAQYQHQIDRVVYENQFNEATGRNEPVEVPVLPQIKRDNYAAHIRDLERRRRLLVNEDGGYGIEGAKRMKQAADESARLLKSIDEERAMVIEVERRAKAIVREERINRLAAAKAAMLRGPGS